MHVQLHWVSMIFHHAGWCSHELLHHHLSYTKMWNRSLFKQSDCCLSASDIAEQQDANDTGHVVHKKNKNPVHVHKQTTPQNATRTG